MAAKEDTAALRRRIENETEGLALGERSIDALVAMSERSRRLAIWDMQETKASKEDEPGPIPCGASLRVDPESGDLIRAADGAVLQSIDTERAGKKTLRNITQCRVDWLYLKYMRAAADGVAPEKRPGLDQTLHSMAIAYRDVYLHAHQALAAKAMEMDPDHIRGSQDMFESLIAARQQLDRLQAIVTRHSRWSKMGYQVLDRVCGLDQGLGLTDREMGLANGQAGRILKEALEVLADYLFRPPAAGPKWRRWPGRKKKA